MSMYLKKVLLPTLVIALLDVAAFAGSLNESDSRSASEAVGTQGNAQATQTDNADNGNKHVDVGSASAFLESDFVRTSVWPGIGPFRSSSVEKQMVDPAGNRLTYSTTGNLISSCQLELHAGPNEGQSLLNLQMSVDFLLEGLGAKPSQIHLVNTEVVKNTKLLVGNNYNPVQANISPLVVSLQNIGVSEGTESSTYRVVVVNKNLSGEEIAKAKIEGSGTQRMSPPAENSQNKADHRERIVAAVSQKPERSIDDLVHTDSERKADAVKVPKNIENKEVASSDGTAKPVVTPKPLSKDEQLKKDFQDVIQNWQRLKKTAVKDRNPSLLSQALAGKALIRQTDAIKWLSANHKYYEMMPGGAKVEKLTAFVPGKKYLVYAEVKEKTKFLDDASNQVLKETDDTYKVNYTIERIDEHWLITDSALAKATADKSAGDKAKKSVARAPH